jgi:DNA repair protein RadA/Sms
MRAQLTRLAKQTGITVILVGHVTKEGALAGPRVLEHIVDTVLYFEGDTHSSFRLIRAVKNRYGAVNEIGVFAMTDKGLKGVSNPSAMFLSQHGQEVPGSCVLVTQEGTRPLLVEIQALVDQAHGNPRRLTVGLDAQRLAMLLAVLHRHAGDRLFRSGRFRECGRRRQDRRAGGRSFSLLAIVSSLKNKALPRNLLCLVKLAWRVKSVRRHVARSAFEGSGQARFYPRDDSRSQQAPAGHCRHRSDRRAAGRRSRTASARSARCEAQRV